MYRWLILEARSDELGPMDSCGKGNVLSAAVNRHTYLCEYHDILSPLKTVFACSSAGTNNAGSSYSSSVFS